MLLLPAAFAAAPLSPAPVDPTGVEIAASFKANRVWLREKACTTADCSAARVEGSEGIQLDWRPLKAIGIFGHVEHVTEEVAAITYAGQGVGWGAGVKAGGAVLPELGVHAWASFDYVTSGSDPDEDEGQPAWTDGSEHFTIEVGGAATFGSADDNFMGWIGADALVFGQDLTWLDTSYQAELMPYLPAELTGGVVVVSEPLGGPWARRGRVTAGIHANVGYRNGIGGWLSAAL